MSCKSSCVYKIVGCSLSKTCKNWKTTNAEEFELFLKASYVKFNSRSCIGWSGSINYICINLQSFNDSNLHKFKFELIKSYLLECLYAKL